MQIAEGRLNLADHLRNAKWCWYWVLVFRGDASDSREVERRRWSRIDDAGGEADQAPVSRFALVNNI